MATEEEIARRFKLMTPHLDERTRRLWVGAEAHAMGRGGREAVARATGLSRTTILHGMKEALDRDAPEDLVAVRRKGAGGKPIEVQQPGIYEALDALVDRWLAATRNRRCDGRAGARASSPPSFWRRASA